jgi:hypothetical protein
MEKLSSQQKIPIHAAAIFSNHPRAAKIDGEEVIRFAVKIAEAVVQ